MFHGCANEDLHIGPIFGNLCFMGVQMRTYTYVPYLVIFQSHIGLVFNNVHSIFGNNLFFENELITTAALAPSTVATVR